MFRTSIKALGEVYERWDDIEFKDKEIVWLPMVIIEKYDNDKWIGWDIKSCMTISVLIQLSRIINIQNDRITIVASIYWFLWPLSWDVWMLYFSLSSFLRKKEIKISEVYERWDDIEFKDKEIVWLLMVIIEKNDNDKWIGWDIRSCMTISILIQLSRIINIQNDRITIVASMYWFLWPLSWDTWMLYFSLNSFLRKKEIKICGYNPIRFYPGGNVGFMVTLKK
ncbi:hypothetical protein H5410_062510 [Solanum commersonii]|uniref:Uncharacterized protein n=1 Tax=Solanum commersonii TaxID=4109 RepID=A0A9J5WCJ1_SOLCO|nr:hypothetical protein H5410_062510 [Solanum commersonii]